MSKERVSGRRKRAPRGVHLSVHNNKRGDADEALEKRLREVRRQRALDEARLEQERLERRIERERANPALGPTLGALYAAEVADSGDLEVDDQGRAVVAGLTLVETPALALRFPDLPWEGDGQSLAIGQARALLRQGYNIRRVVRQSGVGLKWLDDIPIDEAGFGLPR